MKTRYCIAILYLMMYSNEATACPTCVGRVSKKSAPFFSEECYKNTDNEVDKLQLNTRQADQDTTPTIPLKNQGE